MGDKNDDGKTRWDLIPWEEMIEVARAFEHGVTKYGTTDGWRTVEDARARYFAATMRHLIADRLVPGSTDVESGVSHLAHAAACVLILLAHSRRAPEAPPLTTREEARQIGRESIVRRPFKFSTQQGGIDE